MLLSGECNASLQEHLAVISLSKIRAYFGPCFLFLPSDPSRHLSLQADLNVAFAGLFSGLKLHFICPFSYCKDWISPLPIIVWLQVNLSAVSLFCLTEVTPVRHSSFCFSCLVTRDAVGDFCSGGCVYPRKPWVLLIKQLLWITVKKEKKQNENIELLAIFQGSVK